jgi:hypothetical protein
VGKEKGAPLGGDEREKGGKQRERSRGGRGHTPWLVEISNATPFRHIHLFLARINCPLKQKS